MKLHQRRPGEVFIAEGYPRQHVHVQRPLLLGFEHMDTTFRNRVVLNIVIIVVIRSSSIGGGCGSPCKEFFSVCVMVRPEGDAIDNHIVEREHTGHCSG